MVLVPTLKQLKGDCNICATDYLAVQNSRVRATVTRTLSFCVLLLSVLLVMHECVYVSIYALFYDLF